MDVHGGNSMRIRNLLIFMFIGLFLVTLVYAAETNIGTKKTKYLL